MHSNSDQNKGVAEKSFTYTKCENDIRNTGYAASVTSVAASGQPNMLSDKTKLLKFKIYK